MAKKKEKTPDFDSSANNSALNDDSVSETSPNVGLPNESPNVASPNEIPHVASPHAASMSSNGMETVSSVTAEAPDRSAKAEDRDRQLSLFVRQKIQMSPDSPFVYQPRFVNKEKTRVKAIVRLADGRLTEVEADRNDLKSPFIRDVFAQYSEDEIDLFTERHLLMVSVRREVDQRMAEDSLIAAQREKTYAAKSEAFQTPEVNAPENLEFKSKIRQARTATEVHAWMAALLLKSMKNQSHE